MSKQLSDLFDDFLKMSPEDQLEKVRKIRHTRTIERPKSAQKRQVRQAKKDDKNKKGLGKMLKGMSAAERKALIEALKND